SKSSARYIPADWDYNYGYSRYELKWDGNIQSGSDRDWYYFYPKSPADHICVQFTGQYKDVQIKSDQGYSASSVTGYGGGQVLCLYSWQYWNKIYVSIDPTYSSSGQGFYEILAYQNV
ncbi:MAG: hypothetical protein D6732_19780, partial [Methanobacteriota archaeon]